MSSIEPGYSFISEDELKGLLERWLAPEPSNALDQRVANSYYKEFGSASAAANSVLLPQSQNEVRAMKFCSTCREEFADKFSFCPVDGTPLTAPVVAAVVEPEKKVVPAGGFSERVATPVLAGAGAAAMLPRGEYHLTFIDDAGLVTRLSVALREVAHASELTWPEFKRDPFGFTKRMIAGYGQALWRFLSQPNVATGVLTALAVMITAIFGILWVDRVQTRRAQERAAQEELVVDQLIDIPSDQPTPDVGTAGLNKGKGGGSKPQQEK